ncbi:hypothetical protein CCR97_07960 [Rhodoplanes elegans]|uniref:Uncharacterized protein n=1 Tax=Rhodoplanes elegans TaxID=29408 RepID=A0A327KSY4_9BRAD|nr:hypothetical protein [Rhodoplanes elegans]MBK5958053.1 hypothetical protein [Rhodoplanes elegans]MBK5958145.1 hypothetical protein [Rhodoplanes elegans]RAI40432.1 hypothetical protein CH338_06210 [Rhodoplanes elegans]
MSALQHLWRFGRLRLGLWRSSSCCFWCASSTAGRGIIASLDEAPENIRAAFVTTNTELSETADFLARAAAGGEVWPEYEAELTRVKADRDAARRDLAEAAEALEACEGWIARWSAHVGFCRGGNTCTCGRTAVLHTASDLIARLQSTEKTDV